VTGVPAAANWNPTRQKAVIEYLIGAGADPNAAALGGVTPLHRAVRNRCSAAVEALLRAGADPEAANDRGSTPSDLSRRTTGRGGAGSPAAKAEQRIIIDLLSQAATPHLRLADCVGDLIPVTKTIYYVSTSIDGFIAGADDSLDWLYEIDPSDRDISQFASEVGVVAMGAATYECVLRDSALLEHPERWQEAHSGRPVWVFTHRGLPRVPGADITFVSGDVRRVHPEMVSAALGRNILIAGGGGLATAFAQAGLLDEMFICVVPVMLASGKPVFTGSLTSAQLRLSKAQQVGQVAYLTYRVLAANAEFPRRSVPDA
jgi:dihydrofolate reductase